MNTELLFLALVIVIWWMGVWGLLDTILHFYIQGKPQRALVMYSVMVASVLALVLFKPDILERFV
jgi:hypothetical protein